MCKFTYKRDLFKGPISIIVHKYYFCALHYIPKSLMGLKTVASKHTV